MFLFISFVTAIISLYYLGVMADSYNEDTTYLTPIVILLIFSILSIVRELKKNSLSWIAYDDDDYYRGNAYTNNKGVKQNNIRIYNTGSHICNSSEKVEYFLPNKKEKSIDKNIKIHYPSSSEVREKVKELEKSRWFRFKKGFASIFAIDITAKYYKEFKKPYKISRNGKIIPIDNKKSDSRFAPPNSDGKSTQQCVYNKEKEEYNAVTKLMGNRSCEITLTNEEAQIKNSNDGQ